MYTIQRFYIAYHCDTRNLLNETKHPIAIPCYLYVHYNAINTAIEMPSSSHNFYYTFAMHLCRVRSCSKVGSSSFTTVPPLKVASGKDEPTINLHVRPKNRWTPSIPLVFQVLESLEAQCNTRQENIFVNAFYSKH